MDKQILGSLITALRQSNNVKQKELAMAMHVSVTAISNWERGLNYPDLESLQNLANYFHLSIAEIFDPEETLQKLQQKESPKPDMASRISEAPKKRLSKKFIGVLLATSILLGIICFIILFIHYQNHYSARMVAQRVGEDAVYGPSYDIAFVIQGELPFDRRNSFEKAFLSSILQSGTVPNGTKVIRFYYYTNENQAINWRTTRQYSYSIL